MQTQPFGSLAILCLPGQKFKEDHYLVHLRLCKPNTEFNGKITKHFLCTVQEFSLQVCALVWFEKRKKKTHTPKRNFDLQQECNLGKYAKFLMPESLSPASLCRPDLLCSEVQCNYCSLACSDVCSEGVPE